MYLCKCWGLCIILRRDDFSTLFSSKELYYKIYWNAIKPRSKIGLVWWPLIFLNTLKHCTAFGIPGASQAGEGNLGHWLFSCALVSALFLRRHLAKHQGPSFQCSINATDPSDPAAGNGLSCLLSGVVCSDFNGLHKRFSEIPHIWTRLTWFERSQNAIGVRQREAEFIIGDVGGRAVHSCRVHAARRCSLLLLCGALWKKRTLIVQGRKASTVPHIDLGAQLEPAVPLPLVKKTN